MFLKVFTGSFDKDAGSRKFPRVVPVKLRSQLIFFEFDLNGLEQTTSFLRFHSLFLGLENNFWLKSIAIRLDSLPEELVLLWLVPHENLCWRDIAHYIDPLRKFLDLASCCLVDGRLPHPKGCEVEFAHGCLEGVGGVKGLVHGLIWLK